MLAGLQTRRPGGIRRADGPLDRRLRLMSGSGPRTGGNWDEGKVGPWGLDSTFSVIIMMC